VVKRRCGFCSVLIHRCECSAERRQLPLTRHPTAKGMRSFHLARNLNATMTLDHDARSHLSDIPMSPLQGTMTPNSAHEANDRVCGILQINAHRKDWPSV
jgi:hypothetical protein